jgi:hypothetical protein
LMDLSSIEGLIVSIAIICTISDSESWLKIPKENAEFFSSKDAKSEPWAWTMCAKTESVTSTEANCVIWTCDFSLYIMFILDFTCLLICYFVSFNKIKI